MFNDKAGMDFANNEINLIVTVKLSYFSNFYKFHNYIENNIQLIKWKFRSTWIEKWKWGEVLESNINKQDLKAQKFVRLNILTSNMWSRKGIPVLLSGEPTPSKFNFTATFVSFVTLFTDPIRSLIEHAKTKSYK